MKIKYVKTSRKKVEMTLFKFWILIMGLSPLLSSGQGGQCNKWYFGVRAGLDFNTTPPTPITNSALNAVEGCASISDNTGSVLFYTDGVLVYDKTHTVMPNGSNLFGHASSSQSSIIVPKPGTFNASLGRYDHYYIITVDYNGGSSGIGVPGEGTRGVCYSEVDMSLNAGKGDIIAGVKNIFLFGTSTTEKITATQHENGCDFWVIGRPTFSTDFYSYHISAAGINTVAVVSSIPSSNYSPPLSTGVGYMKVSPNSKMIAVINGFDPDPTTAPYECGLFVYDFNNATGILSPKFFSIGSGGSGTGGAGGAYPYAFGINRLGYGVEFSPDNKLIYTTGLPGNAAISRTIQQYDLNVATNALFQASRQTIGTTTSPVVNANNYTACALQLGPDKKIYVALDGNDSISVINNPNVAGTACNFSDRSVPVGTGAKVSKYGLPNFVSTIISPVNKILMLDSCITTGVRFHLLDTSRVLSYNWSFTPLATPSATVYTATTPTISANFPSSGLYVATLNLTYACYQVIMKDTFNVGPPSFTVSSTGICPAGTGTLIATGLSSSYTYSWSPGLSATTGSMVTGSPSSTQSYSIIAKDIKGCVANTTASITVYSNPIMAVSSVNHVKCFGQSTGSITVVPSGGAGSGYSITPSVSGLAAGTYTIVLSDANSCKTATTITITQPLAALATSVASTNSVLCKGGATGWATASTTGGTPAYSYIWQGNPSTTNVAAGYSVGTYTYHVTDANACVSATHTFVISEPSASLTIGPVSQINVLCNGQSNGSFSLTAQGGTPSYSYTWTGASSITNSAFGLSPGNYTVTVSDNSNCTASRTFTITEPALLSASVGSTSQAGCNLANGSATLSVSGGTPSYTYGWLTSSGTTFTTTASSTHNLAMGSVTVTVHDVNGCATQQTLAITNPPNPVVASTATNVSCFGASNGAITTTVSSGTPSYAYQWNTGASTSGLSNLVSGTYTVIVTDASNCSATHTVAVLQPSNNLNLMVNYVNTFSCGQQGVVTASASVSGGTPAYTYVWQPGNINNSSVTDVPAGTYTLTVSDINGCSTNTILAIDAPYTPLSVAIANVIQSKCDVAAGEISVTVSGGTPAYTYLWNTGAQTANLYNLQNGDYQLVVTDSKNCTSAIRYTLECDFEVFIPEYFTPNGDGKNDFFEIKSISQFPGNTLTIFNRWGSVVYTKKNYANEWNGKSNASDATGSGMLAAGTYFVVLDFGDNGKTEAYHGFVQLEY